MSILSSVKGISRQRKLQTNGLNLLFGKLVIQNGEIYILTSSIQTSSINNIEKNKNNNLGVYVGTLKGVG